MNEMDNKWIGKNTIRPDGADKVTGRAEYAADTIMPGFTHLQVAQPITMGHYFLSYIEMLGRDIDRFEDAQKRANECPLGSCALAGTSFEIDREFTAKELGFSR